jgi:hypothetical protein
VVETTARVAKARLNIIQNEVGEFLDHLLRCKTGRKQIEDVDDANPHPTDAGTATALARIDGDSVRDLSHWSTSQGTQYPPGRWSGPELR